MRYNAQLTSTILIFWDIVTNNLMCLNIKNNKKYNNDYTQFTQGSHCVYITMQCGQQTEWIHTEDWNRIVN